MWVVVAAAGLLGCQHTHSDTHTHSPLPPPILTRGSGLTRYAWGGFELVAIREQLEALALTPPPAASAAPPSAQPSAPAVPAGPSGGGVAAMPGVV